MMADSNETQDDPGSAAAQAPFRAIEIVDASKLYWSEFEIVPTLAKFVKLSALTAMQLNVPDSRSKTAMRIVNRDLIKFLSPRTQVSYRHSQ
jgi:hypothetical protein